MNQSIIKSIISNNDISIQNIGKIIDKQSFIEFLQSNGITIVNSRDGEYSIVSEKGKSKTDFSQNLEYFDGHIDGFYKNPIPSTILLYCISPGNNPIPTFYANTVEAYYSLSKEVQNCLNKLTMVYIHSDKLKHRKPLVETLNNKLVLNIITRGYFSIDPTHSTIEDVPQIYEVINAINLLNDSINKLKKSYVWKAGDLMILNNREFIHGRGKSNSISEGRELLRIWIK